MLVVVITTPRFRHIESCFERAPSLGTYTETDKVVVPGLVIPAYIYAITTVYPSIPYGVPKRARITLDADRIFFTHALLSIVAARRGGLMLILCSVTDCLRRNLYCATRFISTVSSERYGVSGSHVMF